MYESLFCFRTCFTPSVVVGPSHNLGKVTHSFFKKPTTIPDCSLTLEEIAQWSLILQHCKYWRRCRSKSQFKRHSCTFENPYSFYKLFIAVEGEVSGICLDKLGIKNIPIFNYRCHFYSVQSITWGFLKGHIFWYPFHLIRSEKSL